MGRTIWRGALGAQSHCHISFTRTTRSGGMPSAPKAVPSIHENSMVGAKLARSLSQRRINRSAAPLLFAKTSPVSSGNVGLGGQTDLDRVTSGGLSSACTGFRRVAFPRWISSTSKHLVTGLCMTVITGCLPSDVRSANELNFAKPLLGVPAYLAGKTQQIRVVTGRLKYESSPEINQKRIELCKLSASLAKEFSTSEQQSCYADSYSSAEGEKFFSIHKTFLADEIRSFTDFYPGEIAAPSSDICGVFLVADISIGAAESRSLLLEVLKEDPSGLLVADRQSDFSCGAKQPEGELSLRRVERIARSGSDTSEGVFTAHPGSAACPIVTRYIVSHENVGRLRCDGFTLRRAGSAPLNLLYFRELDRDNIAMPLSADRQVPWAITDSDLAKLEAVTASGLTGCVEFRGKSERVGNQIENYDVGIRGFIREIAFAECERTN